MKKAIVTGATGFIGKFLLRELLSQGVEVIAVIRKNSNNFAMISSLPVRVIECDLVAMRNLPQLISDRDIDTVFHIAWQGVSDADARNEEVQLQNLKSTLDLIDSAKEMNIKTFVGAGSIHEAEAIVEMSQDKPVDNMGFMYKTCKTAAHWMGKAKAGKYGIRFFWPLINTYGEEEKSARLINTVIRKVLAGESPALSHGEQYYDFVHVSDVAHALFLIAEKGVDGKNYVISSGKVQKLKEYLKVVGRIANEMSDNDFEVELGFGEIANNVVYLPEKTFDSTSLQKDTGFKPVISFETGICRTVIWIKNNK